MTDMIVFWKYDQFPFALHDRLSKATNQHVWVENYGNLRLNKASIIAILPEPMALDTIVALEKLTAQKEQSDKAYHDAARKLFQ